MIDTSNAKWDLSKEEKYAVKWFNDNGFDGELDKQLLSKTKFNISKNGVLDTFELPNGLEKVNIKNIMSDYARSFDMLCKLKGR
ncbi:MAG: hypothetical protein II304_07410 [Bacteroidales bacterium]|nr:hypothetical protein [Bacteroidales bacterium]